MTDIEFDPFDDDTATTPAKKTPAKKAAAKTDDDGFRLGITIKGGPGFEVPWLTPSYPSAVAAAEDLEKPEVQEAYVKIMDFTARMNAAFQKKVAEYAPQKQAAAAPSNRAPQGAVEPPPGTPDAPGPDWTYRTGVGKNGKTWKAWMPPRGSNEQPVWL